MPTARAMTLLAHHVPLSLLLDLADPEGPSSSEIFYREPPISLTRSG
jgi:hypothetical protein